MCIQILQWSYQMWLLIQMFWGGPEILCFWPGPSWCLSVWSVDSILKSKGVITDCLWPFTSFGSDFLLLLWLCHKIKICVEWMFLLREKSSTMQIWKPTWDMKETEVFVSQQWVSQTSVKYFLKNTIWFKKLLQCVKNSCTLVWL